ncbi:hypothetical protein [Abyssogena phaseoliformis symbiont]|uniref:hypothetical protein n=1 Tax=Abyssogena phaseoliformis symbiont TaxID=596095 RepID=UPI001915BA1B|nr:hypothetical protein [Abyssogena phaseoliformis symbiont]
MRTVDAAALVCFFQFLLVFLKHLNMRVIISSKVAKSMMITFFIQLSWLVSSGLGIKGFLEGDLLIVAVFLLSDVAGVWFNFKFDA